MLICKYGCGQEAKYKLKNGNDCGYHDLKCEGGD